jgi:hypothetical protein
MMMMMMMMTTMVVMATTSYIELITTVRALHLEKLL